MDVSPSDGGTVQIDHTISSSYPVTSTFSSGASIRLEAISASGYRFNNWSGDLAGTTNPTTVVIDCNKKITANFSQIMHTLTMQVNGSGSITPAVGNHDYGEGIVVHITATPHSGWQFNSWTGDVADPDMPNTTVTVASDKTVTANFSQIIHTLTMQVNGSGSITPAVGNHDYGEGIVVHITATPHSGWQFNSWTGDVADPDMPNTTVTVASDKTVTANFSQVNPSWWLIGGIIAGVTIIAVIIWLVVRSKAA